jgi:hypothetical protein
VVQVVTLETLQRARELRAAILYFQQSLQLAAVLVDSTQVEMVVRVVVPLTFPHYLQEQELQIKVVTVELVHLKVDPLQAAVVVLVVLAVTLQEAQAVMAGQV